MKQTIINIGLLLAVCLAIACSTSEKSEADPDYASAFPPVASQPEQEPQFLEYGQIKNMTIEYLALTTWNDLLLETAQNQPEILPAALMSQPDPACAQVYVLTIEEKGEADSTELSRCAEMAFLHRNPTEWFALNQVAREARTRRALIFLWQSTDPRQLMTVILANRRALNITQETDQDFRSFSANYQKCDMLLNELLPDFLVAETPQLLAAAWITAEARLKACGNEVTERLFPINPEIPLPTE